MNKEEIQRMKLSDLYFKHLDATWEEIRNKIDIKSELMKTESRLTAYTNKHQYLFTYTYKN